MNRPSVQLSTPSLNTSTLLASDQLRLLREKCRKGSSEECAWEELLSTVSSSSESGITSLDGGLSLPPLDSSNNTLLHYIAIGGRVEWAQQVLNGLRRESSAVNEGNLFGWTPLLLAAYYGHASVVRTFLTCGMSVDVDASTVTGVTALQCSILQHHLPILQLLLAHKASLNHKPAISGGAVYPSARGNPSTMYPSRPTQEKTAAALRQDGGRLVRDISGGRTPLMLAAHCGKTSVVSFLLQHGAEVNAQCKLNGWTALMYAASACSSVTVVKMLLDRGADGTVKTWSGLTAVAIARQQDHGAVADYIESWMGQASAATSEMYAQELGSPKQHNDIFEAIVKEDIARIQHILHVDPSAIKQKDTSEGVTPLIMAAMRGDAAVTKLLLQKGASVHDVDPVGWNALLYAAYYNHMVLVQLLLDAGSTYPLPVDKSWSEARLLEEFRNITRDTKVIELLRGSIVRTKTKGSHDALPSDGSGIPRERSDSSDDQQGWIGRIIRSSRVFRKISGNPSPTVTPQQDLEWKPRRSKKKTRAMESNGVGISQSKEDPVTFGPGSEMRPRRGTMGSNSSPMSPGNMNDSMRSVQDSLNQSVVSTLPGSPEHPFGVSQSSNANRTYFHYRDASGSSVGGGGIGGGAQAQQQSPGRASRSMTHRREKSGGSISRHSISTTASSDNSTEARRASRAADVSELCAFLEVLDLETYQSALEKEHVTTIQGLTDLTDHDLEVIIGIKSPGHRRLLLLSSQSWKKEQHRLQFEKTKQRMQEYCSVDLPANSTLNISQSSLLAGATAGLAVYPSRSIHKIAELTPREDHAQSPASVRPDPDGRRNEPVANGITSIAAVPPAIVAPNSVSSNVELSAKSLHDLNISSDAMDNKDDFVQALKQKKRQQQQQQQQRT